MKPKKRSTQNDIRGNKDLSKAMIAELKRFREYHPANRFLKNLRRMLIEFLMFDGATEASYLQDLLYDLEGLFELLDVLETADGPVVHPEPQEAYGFRKTPLRK